ncbi:MAG: hypothetical protein ACPG7F_14160, partial [Aggregatilineales bacterium]
MKKLIPVLILIPALVVIFHQLALTDMILARGDTYVYFYPYRDALHEALRNGELPLWTSDIFMGVPLLANPQVGTFYPLNWLTVPFSTPDAIRLQVFMHLMLAGTGVFLLYRRIFSRNAVFPALIAALIFAAGGYSGAHVEQINQLQGIAWLPAIFYALHYLMITSRKMPAMLLIALLFALQLVTGHTQTVFITGIGLGLYVLLYQFTREKALSLKMRHSLIVGLLLLGAAMGALVLASPQLLPTMELTGLSNRSGGFSAQEATSFSLPPHYIGRSFLPNYDGQLFGEYVAYTGIIGLVLAAWGIVAGRDTSRQKWLWLTLAIIGLLLAFGRYNPVYMLLAELPGFNFFRVPARWLALTALSLSLLAGYGCQILLQQSRPALRPIFFAMLPIIALIGLARFVLPALPVDAGDFIGTLIPDMHILLAWTGTLIVVAGLIITRRFITPRYTGFVGGMLFVLVTMELIAAGVPMPYNKTAPRGVYEGQRFTISQMMAYADTQTPPGRMLSISGLLFEVGDKAVLDAQFDRAGMDDRAIETAYRAIKQQTVFAPNLPLTWNVPSVDGYGGGLLPLNTYSQFTSLLLPDNSIRSADGRIGEMLVREDCRGACIPDAAWLDMANVEYLIVDKVHDVVHEGIFYDTALTFDNPDVQVYPPLNAPEFEATHLYMLYRGEDLPGLRYRTLDDAYLNLYERDPDIETVSAIQEDFNLLRVSIDKIPGLLYTDENSGIQAISAVDTQTGDFIQLTPPGWIRALSTEIKIYRRAPLPRVVIALNTQTAPDTWQGGEDVLLALKNNDDSQRPGFQAYLHTDTPETISTGDNTGWSGSTTEIISYTDTRIEID